MLIGLNGQMGSGKNTVAERARLVIERWANLNGTKPIEVIEISFADKLKDSACALLGITREHMEHYKNLNDVEIVLYDPHGDHGLRYAFDDNVTLNMRLFLQRYGTEAHRDIFGDGFWVEQAFKDVNHRLKFAFVTDVRFPNEAEAIRERHGTIWNIKGPDFNPEPTHPSEQILHTDLIDVEILNRYRDDDFHALDSTLEHLLDDVIEEFTIENERISEWRVKNTEINREFHERVAERMANDH